MDNVKINVDALLEEVDLTKLFDDENDEKEQVNLWIPETYQARYKDLQKRSRKKFGQICQIVLMKMIDKVDPENAPADKQAS
jgi:hypothetical protein